jgi:pimeloyl-ACP methyl ester carboxylesterase
VRPHLFAASSLQQQKAFETEAEMKSRGFIRPFHRSAAAATMHARAALLSLAVSITPLAPAAAQSPPLDPRQGDGRVSAFYQWTEQPAGKPGQLLNSESLPSELGLSEAGVQKRILYTSTNGVDGTSQTIVSGAYFAPKGTPPAGGWPILAWAHGTTGMADICAPSWQSRSYRDMEYLNRWLSEGFAIVATDYEGLGTPGPHPYLKTRPAAYNVLDSVRAILGGDFGVSNNILLVGQSQGGGAAFATAAFAPAYAPDLNIRGTVATGVPYLAAKTLSKPPTKDPNKVDPTLAYILYIGLTLQQTDSSLNASDMFSAQALPVFELARTTCIAAFESSVASASLTRATTALPGFRKAAAAALPAFTYPILKLAQPIFVGTGAEDKDVAPEDQLSLVKDACDAGTVVEAHVYSGLNHGETVNASLKDSLPFVKKVMAGETIVPVCSPQAE